MLDSKQYLTLLFELDENIQTVKEALYPKLNNEPQDSALSEDDFLKLAAFKLELEERRREMAQHVHDAVRREHCVSTRKVRIRKEEERRHRSACASATKLMDDARQLTC